MLHVGYPTVEAMAEQLAADSPVLLMVVEDIQDAGLAGVTCHSHRLIVQAPGELSGRPTVHYVSLLLGHSMRLNGRPDDPDRLDLIVGRGADAREIIAGWLRVHKFHPRDGLIARPRDLKYLDGWARFLRVEQATGRYLYAPPPPATPDSLRARPRLHGSDPDPEAEGN